MATQKIFVFSATASAELQIVVGYGLQGPCKPTQIALRWLYSRPQALAHQRPVSRPAKPGFRLREVRGAGRAQPGRGARSALNLYLEHLRKRQASFVTGRLS